VKRYLWFVLCCSVLLAALSAPALAAGSANPNPGVIPLNAKVGGLTYAEWGDRWWQWVFSIPADDNPLLDLTGEKAAIGQSPGPVFFLVGLWNYEGQASVERQVTVRPDKALFFPMLNADFWIADICLDEEGKCAEGWGGDDLIQMFYSCLDVVMSGAGDLHATLDGQPLQEPFKYRVNSSHPFTCQYPEYSIVSDYVGEGDGVFPISVADGYWLMLSPLKKGEHVLTFGGTSCTGASLGVTYHITVK